VTSALDPGLTAEVLAVIEDLARRERIKALDEERAKPR
jgi:ABC-type histidine transport system ATPase subunit